MISNDIVHERHCKKYFQQIWQLLAVFGYLPPSDPIASVLRRKPKYPVRA